MLLTLTVNYVKHVKSNGNGVVNLVKADKMFVMSREVADSTSRLVICLSSHFIVLTWRPVTVTTSRQPADIPDGRTLCA